jgi:hypothetical protein
MMRFLVLNYFIFGSILSPSKTDLVYLCCDVHIVSYFCVLFITNQPTIN